MAKTTHSCLDGIVFKLKFYRTHMVNITYWCVWVSKDGPFASYFPVFKKLIFWGFWKTTVVVVGNSAPSEYSLKRREGIFFFLKQGTCLFLLIIRVNILIVTRNQLAFQRCECVCIHNFSSGTSETKVSSSTIRWTRNLI